MSLLSLSTPIRLRTVSSSLLLRHHPSSSSYTLPTSLTRHSFFSTHSKHPSLSLLQPLTRRLATTPNFVNTPSTPSTTTTLRYYNSPGRPVTQIINMSQPAPDVFEAAASGQLDAIKSLGRIHLEAKNDRGWTPVCISRSPFISMQLPMDRIYKQRTSMDERAQ